MNLQYYFSGKSGFGVISTSNNKGEVNSAVYAKPHVVDSNTIAFRICLKPPHILRRPAACTLKGTFRGIHNYSMKFKERFKTVSNGSSLLTTL